MTRRACLPQGESGPVDRCAVTFIGHATVLVELGGAAFLTDPVFSRTVGGLRRLQPPGREPGELPPLSGILVSHAHYDHLDLPSLRQLDPAVPVVLPPRVRGTLRRLGERSVVELHAWETWEAGGGARVTAVPARHFGGRLLVDSAVRPASGYVVEAGGRAVYFAGDTSPSNPFEEIGARFALDAALLPVGAYRPRWFMRRVHMDPADAVRAFEMLGAGRMIPIHWGTFRLSLEPAAEPIRLLREAAARRGLSDRVSVLEPGETWTLETDCREAPEPE